MAAGAPVIVSLLIALGLASTTATYAAAEPGVTETEIVIGCSTSLSGPLAFTGAQVTRSGIDVYVKAVNDAGGVHGRKIRTVYLDDAYAAEPALANTRTLVERDRVFAIVAPLGTSPVAATLAYLDRQRVPLVFPLQDSPVVRGRKYVIAGTMLADRQARILVEYLVRQRHHGRFAVIHGADDHGTRWLRLLRHELEKNGAKTVSVEAIKPGVMDLTAPVAHARATKPDVTLLVLTPGAAAQALKEREKIGWRDTVMVAVGPLADDRYLGLGAAAAEGVEGLAVWPDPFTSDSPGMRRYRTDLMRYVEKAEPSRYSLAGYFAAMLFVEGVKRAGRDLTRDRFMTALESLDRWDSGIVPPLSIGADHETQKRALWVRLQKTGFRALTDWLSAE